MSPPSARRADDLKRRAVLLFVLALAAGVCVVLAIVMRGLSRHDPDFAADKYASGPRSSADALPVLWKAPSFSFPDQHEKKLGNADLAGKVWIADFIFTQCTTVCPRITARMAVLQRKLTDERLRFVSFSVDPEHDTEQALAKYAGQWRPKETRWALLRTEAGPLAEISRGMRVALEKSDSVDNPIVHTSMFFLVDREGSVRGVYNSEDGAALQRLVHDTNELLGESTQPRAVNANLSGEEIYRELGCGACHERPALAPALDGIAGRQISLQGDKTAVADAAYVRESILEPGAKMVAGFTKLMPSYDGQLEDREIANLVAYVMALPATGDAGSGAPTPASSPRPSATAAEPSLAIDPVCSMEVKVTDETPRATHAGHSFYFCSDSCRDRFEKAPDEFLDGGKH